ncbi:MAG: hypothetical protein JST37_02560 [Bacteroidetes bacterium]|jgi:hypothetical protein|nr:hypothetical protein [Bacteroidota bacterium]
MTIACRAKNKKHYRDYRKVYRQTHVDQIRFNSWKSYHKNREQRLENSRKYWAENKERLAEKRREYAREYRRKNRERITASRRLYYLQNRQKAIDRAKESYYRRTAKHEPTN